MMKYMIAVLVLLAFAPPALAQFREADDSYYGRQMKSCIHPAPRKNFWDLFEAFHEDAVDSCCADSVKMMEYAKATRIAADDTCPQGTFKKSLDCPTSKHWCQKSSAK